MVLAAKMDEYGGKGGWIAATVLAFCLYWPIGLAFLAYLAFSGRMRAWRQCGPGRWHNQPGQQSGPWAAQGSGQQAGSGQGAGCGWGGWNWGGRNWGSQTAAPSGNQAFDEYRAETIRRLEEEQREFFEYLERLRRAKDKAEFDQFMADRRRRTTPPDEPTDLAT